jgi:sugar lactone lactonase YvrE
MRWARISRLLLCFAAPAASSLGCGAPTKPVASAPSSAPTRPTTGAPTRDPDAPIYVSDAGFKTPESVLHDTRADVYLLSNIEGSPLAADGQAFISRVRPDGSVENLRWIDGGAAGVQLDAPKGMAIAGEVLYVADISFVRKFERSTGRPIGSVKIEGATFINDVCADADGNVYVSDSGISTGFMPSGGDAIYKLEARDQFSVVARSATLGRPNGLSASSDGLWVATFGSGELYKLTRSGERSAALRPPKGSLDGVVQWKQRVFVSSWEGSSVYELSDGRFEERVSGVAAPSDIGFDEKRQRLLIPLFYDDTLVIQPLPRN